MNIFIARGVRLLDGIAQDVRYGMRLLSRSPWFTIVGVASLAIGLGSSVALFTFTNALLLRPLPGRDTTAIHATYTSNTRGGRYGGSSFSDFQSFTTSVPGLFSAACATTNTRGTLVADATPHILAGAVVNGGCFDALRVRPHLGRLLTPADDSANGGRGIVISHTHWLRAFRGDPTIVGRQGVLNGAAVVIVGVAEPGFAGVSLDAAADFWAPSSMAPMLLGPDTLTARDDRRFRIYVRLGDGVTAAQAADRLAVIAAGLRAEHPRVWAHTDGSTRIVTITPERQARFATSGGAVEAIGMATFGAIAAIVAIACVNLATMIVARGAGRTRELNVRLALGASRGRLLRQLATESLLISVAGSAAGMLIVAVGLELFEVNRPAEIPAFNLAIDWRVAGFSILMALVAPAFFGLAPGVHALRLAIGEGLKGRVLLIRSGVVRFGSRELLVLAQIAVSFALLIMATLFMQSLMAAGPTEQGVPVGMVAVVPIDLNVAARSSTERHALAERLLQTANRVAGVEGATAAAMVPRTGSFTGFIGRAEDRPDQVPIEMDANMVAPGYLELARVGLRAGRSFDARDHERAPRVAVISESLARRLWASTTVVGRAIRIGDDSREVVGVVADVPYRSLSDASHPVIYVPLAQSPRQSLVIHARVNNEGETIAALDRALRGVDARILVGPAMPLGQLLDQTRIGGRVAQWIGAGAGLLQLGLALMATWALVAYAVQRRTTEIAIRRALGATERSIVRLVLQPTLWLLAIGTVIGGIAGVAAAQVLHASFLGLAPIEGVIAAPALAALAAVVVAGAWLPARRAVAAEPAAALKEG